MLNSIFSILITTKNRKEDLRLTLSKIQHLFLLDNVNCVVYDDGSTDGTFLFVKNNFPDVILYRNEISKGYLYCRNKMLNENKTDYAISLDDDAHFLTENPLFLIENYFKSNPQCGLIAFRIYWGTTIPDNLISKDVSCRVQSFVGCAHVWNMQAWRAIPNYPEWFVFYGEEDFASYQLFKKNWEISYLPDVLVNHRVDMKLRKKNDDYHIRLRSSLRSGWFLFLLFYPAAVIPRKIAYSIWIQFTTKVLKGDWRVFKIIGIVLIDVLKNGFKILKNRNKLTATEYVAYQSLAPAKIYWVPEIQTT
ncbi:GT2 family glycosyltransferase [Flavobacterium sp. 28A]|uniref:glycosyltransferase family 2 protein n=1 Tax=Flavobacterium sp. 28A TaxID=2735895 RepID=UPI0015703E90|nr:glycosyltransferase [Flavobacterium sp. 28A]NRT15140.1 GT2 family glycosyltransferase [Flavobacterium sp. 28A]